MDDWEYIQAMDDPDINILIAVVAIGALALAGWLYRDQLFPQPEEAAVTAPAPEVPQPAGDKGPEYPVPELENTDPVTGKLVPLPPLDDSDAYFLLEIGNVFGSDFESLLVRDALIDKFVATIDNLAREHVSEKIRPVGRLSQPFRAEVDDDDVIYLDPENFIRYDLLVAKIAAADIDDITDTYRRFYPLFQQSYERLGYPDAYFNDRVIEIIDHLLATPTPEGPIALIRPNVLYQFADPDLEALSAGQKLLLRMGKDHTETVKHVLTELRARLAKP